MAFGAPFFSRRPRVVALVWHALAWSAAGGAGDCTRIGEVYLPDLYGEEATPEDDWEACQKRCKNTQDCSMFAFWPDRGLCHLKGVRDGGEDSKLKWTWGGPQVVSGPPSCPAEPEAPAEQKSVDASRCPGDFKVGGVGSQSLVPSGWAVGKDNGTQKAAIRDGALEIDLGGRAYFAKDCSAGSYDRSQYAALDLRGRTIRYTTDLSGLGCGCNAALYLVAMPQNSATSTCKDYYCDASSSCGVWCNEIDIQEANQFAWHNGGGSGYGGGGLNRNWTSTDYAPGGNCVDTSKPFQVAASFPMTEDSVLMGMEVELSQEGQPCRMNMKLGQYDGMEELSAAMKAGMTPVVSYWKDEGLPWSGGQDPSGGPCAKDTTGCAQSVHFFNFSIDGSGAGPLEVGKSAAGTRRRRPQKGGDASTKSNADEDARPTDESEAEDERLADLSVEQDAPASDEPEEEERPEVESMGQDAGASDESEEDERPEDGSAQQDAGASDESEEDERPEDGSSQQDAGASGESEEDERPEHESAQQDGRPAEGERPANESSAKGGRHADKVKTKATTPKTTRQATTRKTTMTTPTTITQVTETDTTTTKVTDTDTTTTHVTDTDSTTTQVTATTATTTDTTLTTVSTQTMDLTGCSLTLTDDCTFTQCCSERGMQCYNKNEHWSACLARCTPGLSDWDVDEVRTNWTCKELGTRSSGPIPDFIPPSTTLIDLTGCSKTLVDDCSQSQCCLDGGMQCYKKNEYWSACQSSCTPGPNDWDPDEEKGDWTCEELGKRTPKAIKKVDKTSHDGKESERSEDMTETAIFTVVDVDEAIGAAAAHSVHFGLRASRLGTCGGGLALLAGALMVGALACRLLPGRRRRAGGGTDVVGLPAGAGAASCLLVSSDCELLTGDRAAPEAREVLP